MPNGTYLSAVEKNGYKYYLRRSFKTNKIVINMNEKLIISSSKEEATAICHEHKNNPSGKWKYLSLEEVEFI